MAGKNGGEHELKNKNNHAELSRLKLFFMRYSRRGIYGHQCNPATKGASLATGIKPPYRVDQPRNQEAEPQDQFDKYAAFGFHQRNGIRAAGHAVFLAAIWLGLLKYLADEVPCHSTAQAQH